MKKMREKIEAVELLGCRLLKGGWKGGWRTKPAWVAGHVGGSTWKLRAA
jgi:hypothetical protein